MNKNKYYEIIASAIYAVFYVFWVIIAYHGLQGNTKTAELFSATYGVMALFGGVLGIAISRHWGGRRSLIGRAVLFMSLGLLAQEFGQIAYSMYTHLLHQEIPYPSIGDIGFFGSVIFYILAAFSLIKALSTTMALRSRLTQLWIVIVPILLLAGSYYMLLKGHSYDFHHPLTVILDFGYPMGQAFYISLGLLALFLSKKYLGGAMRPVIIFLVFALCLQFVADFTFLYQVKQNTWKTASYNELVYLTAYFVMTLSLIKFQKVFDKFQSKAQATRVKV